MQFRLLISCLVLLASTGLCRASTYYVDSASGGDSNDGISAAAPWRSLDKVNAQVFQPGDSILFKSGSSWTGKLAPKGSGAAGKPIIINSYGGSAKPRIDGGGSVGTGTVYLNNQQYVEINNLEITDDAPAAGDRRGVLVSATEPGVFHHITLRNLDIHHIRGIVGQENDAKRTAGIGFEAGGSKSGAARFDDILIEGCSIYSVENTGLYTDARAREAYPGTDEWRTHCYTGVRIRNNTIHHISKNAMIVRFLDKGVVEHNVCYETALKLTGNTMFSASCDGTVFQYNEGSFNRSPGGDGSMYDADLRSPNTVWQYSYSHDNAHGLFWMCTVQADANIICRYNVSQNDKGIIFCFNYPHTSAYCYNNTVYCGPDTSPTIIAERDRGGAGTRNYFFYNNVIYNSSAAATYLFHDKDYRRTIDSNVFYGKHPSNEPADAHKIVSDPRLADPGAGTSGIGSLEVYRLKSGSPCIGTGCRIPGNGGLDLLGNSLPADGRIDRGAFIYYAPSSAGDFGGSRVLK